LVPLFGLKIAVVVEVIAVAFRLKPFGDILIDICVVVTTVTRLICITWWHSPILQGADTDKPRILVSVSVTVAVYQEVQTTVGVWFVSGSIAIVVKAIADLL
jgi:hypothetical protein